GNELLPAMMGADWYRLSAQNIVSRAKVLSHTYSSEDHQPYIAEVHCPILALFGTAGDVGGEPELEVIRQNAMNALRLETRVVSGADHVYTSREGEVANIVVDWLQSL